MTTIAEHVRNSLDGRWRDVKNQMRERLAEDIFRPHYTPNTVIARTKVAEQMSIMAAAGAADDGFRKEHGGNGNVGAAITTIEMLAMSDLSLMVKAGVQWGLFGGAVENLGTERHHEAYVKKIINLELRGCFAMTETGHGSDVQALETIATYDADTEEFVIHSSTPNARKDYIGGAAETATDCCGFRTAHRRRERRAGQPRRALLSGADPRRRGQRPAGRDDFGLSVQRWSAGCRQRSHRVRPRPRAAGQPAEQIR